MQNFEFRKHMVVETNFKDNGGKKEGESSIDFSGDVAVPKGKIIKSLFLDRNLNSESREKMYICA